MKKAALISVLLTSLCFLYFYRTKRSLDPTPRRPAVSQAIVTNEIRPEPTKKFSALMAIQKPREKIRQAIENDSYCQEKATRSQEEQAKWEADPQYPIELYLGLSAVAGNPEGNACVLAMLAQSIPEALAYATKSNEAPCRFIHALILSGQWRGSNDHEEKQNLNKARAREILQDLGAEFPENAVFPLFELGMLDKDAPATRDAFLKLLRTSTIASPWNFLMNEIRKLGSKNPTAFLFSMHAIGLRHNPYYTPGMWMAGLMVERGEFPVEFAHWVNTLTKRRKEIATTGAHAPYVNPFEESMFQSIVTRGENSPGVDLRLWKDKNWDAYYEKIQTPQEFVGIVNYKQKCEDLVGDIRENFSALQREEEYQRSLPVNRVEF